MTKNATASARGQTSLHGFVRVTKKPYAVTAAQVASSFARRYTLAVFLRASSHSAHFLLRDSVSLALDNIGDSKVEKRSDDCSHGVVMPVWEN